MATAVAGPPNVLILIAKLYDPDSDIRFMSLTDLRAFFRSSQSSILASEYNTCAKLADGLIHTIGDSNGEVQNLAIKALGPFVNKAHASIMCPFVGRLADMDLSHSVDQSIRALALRSVVVALPRPARGEPRSFQVLSAYGVMSKVMIPRLIGYNVFTPAEESLPPPPPQGLLLGDIEKNTDNNNLDVLTEVARCFGPMLRPGEVDALHKSLLQFLEHDRLAGSIKKKAVTAMSALATYFSKELMSEIVTHIIQSMKDSHVTPTTRKLYISLMGSIARSIPRKFGPHLRTVAPFVLAAVSQEELDEQMSNIDEEDDLDPQQDEVREAAFLAIDAFLAGCSSDMQHYLDDCYNATLRFIKYDPTLAYSGYGGASDDDADDDSDMEDDFGSEQDFETDIDGAAEDDLSWKIRRCAARTLHTLVSVVASGLMEDGPRFSIVMNALLERLEEREEVVRVEILTTLGFLISKVGDQQTHAMDLAGPGNNAMAAAQPTSRKRRRGASDVSMSEPSKVGRLTGSMSPESWSPPHSGPPANLAQLSDHILKGLLKLLRSSTSGTKVAAMGVLKDLVVARHGNMDESLPTLIGLIVENINSGAATVSVGPTTGAPLQTQALQLMNEVAKAHSSTAILPHLPLVLPAVLDACRNKYPAIADDALSTLDQLVKAATPPRTASGKQQSGRLIEQMYNALIELIGSKAADLLVRQHAIADLGTLVGRTLGKGCTLLSPDQRIQAFQVLDQGIKNETTRLASLRSIEAVAQQAPDKTRFDSHWFFETCVETGNQLRKSDRNLRLAGLSALSTLIIRHGSAGNLDAAAGQRLSRSILQSLLTSDDLTVLGPILTLYATMIRYGCYSIDKDFISSICALIKTSTAASVLVSLCDLANAIGEKGQAKPLMTSLLMDVGVSGSAAVVGKVIGNLLVSGGAGVGVTTQDFLNELRTTKDDKRKSLALSILGETGLLSGSAAQLSPKLFLDYFDKSSDVQLSAAVSLGRACAGPGNVQQWLPGILARLQSHPDDSYLILHTVKELLQYNKTDRDIIPFTSQLWEASMVASRPDLNKTIGAECVANLTLTDPGKYMPVLQSLLNDSSATVRGTAIAAFRDIFTISDASFDKDLRPMVVEVLTTMMRDSDVENRRSSLNTFNAAARNKPSLVIPQIGQLLPLVLDQSFKDPTLMREIAMGPFKHVEDDGLEVRKNAYETIYFLVESAMSRLDMAAVYDRVVEGLNDDRGIQTLCNLLVTKLSFALPDDTIRRLDKIAKRLSTILEFKPKENAVRHEHEKADEAKRNAIRVTLGLINLFPEVTTAGNNWRSYTVELRKGPHAEMVKEIEKETKEAKKA